MRAPIQFFGDGDPKVLLVRGRVQRSTFHLFTTFRMRFLRDIRKATEALDRVELELPFQFPIAD